MFAKLPFRTKLVLVVSVPLFVLVGFAGTSIASRFVDLSTQEQYSNLVGPFDRLASVSRAVGDESVASAWSSGALDDPAAKQLLVDARTRTDDAIDALQDAMPAIREHGYDVTRRAAQELLTRLDSLDDARAQVDGGTDPIGVFVSLGGQALDVASVVSSNVNDRELSGSLSGIIDLRRSQLAAAEQATIVERHLVRGVNDTAASWADAIAEEESEIGKFLSSATAAERDVFARASSAAPIDPVRDAAPDSPTTFPSVNTTPAEYAGAYLAKQGAIDGAIEGVESVVNSTANHKVDEARNGALLFAGFTAGVIGFVLFLALALVRSLNRPLRALTRAARDVSERRLPRLVDTLHQGGELAPGQLEELSPIKIDSPDEFGDLAKAFNTIQQVTVSVAEEQSALLRKGIGDLYVNLARRNQSLLDRQISLLDEMEGRSHEPEQLGSLFELDQLATRMRRNAESLLVLAGAGQPRQWRTAVPVIDIVRGAAAEIADFARVTYFGFDDEVAVAGNAVADLTHLLAELLENATGFSSPETSVVVSGQVIDRRFFLTITDDGIGIEPERLIDANQLLARPPAAGLTLSRTLGLHVVGHLAARHGIHVQLRRVPTAGLSAVVSLPASILTQPGDVEPAEPMAPIRSTQRAAAAVHAEPVAMPTDPAPSRAGAHVDGSKITWHPSPSPFTPRPVPPEPTAPPVPVAADPAPNASLPRRMPTRGAWSNDAATASPNPESGAAAGLAARVPGANLTHQPQQSAAPPAGDARPRPRPEQVQEMLTRHQRGVREARDVGDDVQ